MICAILWFMICMWCIRDPYHNIPPSSLAFLVWRSLFVLIKNHYSSSVTIATLVYGPTPLGCAYWKHNLTCEMSPAHFCWTYFPISFSLQYISCSLQICKRSKPKIVLPKGVCIYIYISVIRMHRCMAGFVVFKYNWLYVSLCILENPEKYLHWLVITLTFYLELLSMCITLYVICINHLVSNLFQPNRKRKDSVPEQMKGVEDTQAFTSGNLWNKKYFAEKFIKFMENLSSCF